MTGNDKWLRKILSIAESTQGRNETIEVLSDLMEWNDFTGGWDSPAWARAEAHLNKVRFSADHWEDVRVNAQIALGDGIPCCDVCGLEIACLDKVCMHCRSTLEVQVRELLDPFTTDANMDSTLRSPVDIVDYWLLNDEGFGSLLLWLQSPEAILEYNLHHNQCPE